MGVFSLFRRKADAAVTESTSTEPGEEGVAATPTAQPEAEGDTGATGGCCAAEAAEAVAAAGESGAGERAEGAAAEGVEIPKQQSAEEAADNEAGEGARQ
ncbi:hypothetical protein ABR738_29825 [Streptomyces sp. Edi4]|uniref:hypothetical protein n=1 Tax=Streptomyces sp. Edi4 TaxID=3162527 RepID=UPI0033057307